MNRDIPPPPPSPPPPHHFHPNMEQLHTEFAEMHMNQEHHGHQEHHGQHEHHVYPPIQPFARPGPSPHQIPIYSPRRESQLPMLSTGKVSPTYEAYLYTIIEQPPGEKKTWALAEKLRLDDSQQKMSSQVKDKGGKVMEILKGRTMEGYKRIQVESLLHEKNTTEPDEQFEWKLALIKLNKRRTSDGRGLETGSMQVIIKRVQKPVLVHINPVPRHPSYQGQTVEFVDHNAPRGFAPEPTYIPRRSQSFGGYVRQGQSIIEVAPGRVAHGPPPGHGQEPMGPPLGPGPDQYPHHHHPQYPYHHIPPPQYPHHPLPPQHHQHPSPPVPPNHPPQNGHQDAPACIEILNDSISPQGHMEFMEMLTDEKKSKKESKNKDKRNKQDKKDEKPDIHHSKDKYDNGWRSEGSSDIDTFSVFDNETVLRTPDSSVSGDTREYKGRRRDSHHRRRDSHQERRQEPVYREHRRRSPLPSPKARRDSVDDDYVVIMPSSAIREVLGGRRPSVYEPRPDPRLERRSSVYEPTRPDPRLETRLERRSSVYEPTRPDPRLERPPFHRRGESSSFLDHLDSRRPYESRGAFESSSRRDRDLDLRTGLEPRGPARIAEREYDDEHERMLRELDDRDRLDRVERLERAERLERTERLERVERADRLDRVERLERAETLRRQEAQRKADELRLQGRRMDKESERERFARETMDRERRRTENDLFGGRGFEGRFGR